MNSLYHSEYADLLGRVFDVAYKCSFSLEALEKRISNNTFFKSIEGSIEGLAPIISDVELTKQIFYEVSFDLYEIPQHIQTLWASEAYIYIQEETRLTFEAIFLIFPIEKMLSCFDVYQEMNFSQLVSYFMIERGLNSVFSCLLSKYKYSLRDVEEKTGIPYETLRSLKIKRRDIKKASVEVVSALAKLFKVRIDTLAEIEQSKQKDIKELLNSL